MTTALALPTLLPGELREQGMVIPPDEALWSCEAGCGPFWRRD